MLHIAFSVAGWRSSRELLKLPKLKYHHQPCAVLWPIDGVGDGVEPDEIIWMNPSHAGCQQGLFTGARLIPRTDQWAKSALSAHQIVLSGAFCFICSLTEPGEPNDKYVVGFRCDQCQLDSQCGKQWRKWRASKVVRKAASRSVIAKTISAGNARLKRIHIHNRSLIGNRSSLTLTKSTGTGGISSMLTA